MQDLTQQQVDDLHQRAAAGELTEEGRAWYDGEIAAGRLPAPPTAEGEQEGSTFERAMKNLPGDAERVAGEMLDALTNPLQTAESLYTLGKGAFHLLTPGRQPSEEVARAVGQQVYDRYKDWDSLKESFATTPVETIMDVLGVVSLGTGAAAKLPGAAGRVGRIAETATGLVDPGSLAGRAAVEGGKRVLAPVLGGNVMGTGASGRSIREAAAAGYEGGDRARLFRENFGGGGAERLVDDARQGAANLRRERSKEYVSNRESLAESTKPINVEGLDTALADLKAVGNFEGFNISPKTVGVWQEINETVQNFKDTIPAERRTVMAYDGLKQAIGEIRDTAEFGSPSRKVADTVYGVIRDQLEKEAPKYGDMMRSYENASKLINQLETTLASANPNKGSVDQILRRLMSVTRNNANTNYGQRAALAEVLNEQTGNRIMPAIAGQSLSSFQPRGLVPQGAMGLGGTGGAMGALYSLTGDPMGLALTGLSAASMIPRSPRLMGMGAYGAGAARRLGPSSRAATQGLFQGGRLSAEEERQRVRLFPRR